MSSWVSDFLPVSYFKAAGPTRKIQSSSKLWQVQKGNAEIPDTPLGLTGIGIHWLAHLYFEGCVEALGLRPPTV